MAASKLNFLNMDNILYRVLKHQCISSLSKKGPIFEYPHSKLQPSGVLVPLCENKGELSVLFIKRSMDVEFYKGVVAFPGGRREAQDKSFVDTMLREVKEELGIPTSSVDVWYEMKRTYPGRYFEVELTPVIGFIKDFDSLKIEKCQKEIEDVFTVPLKELSDPRNHSFEHMETDWILPIFSGGKYIIRDITALILQEVISSLLPEGLYNDLSKQIQYPPELKKSQLRN